MLNADGETLSKVLTDLRSKQVHAEMMVNRYTAEAKKWKEEGKSLTAQIARTIDEDTKPNLFTDDKPKDKAKEKPGKTYDVAGDGTVVLKQGAAAAETIPVKAETNPPVPVTTTPEAETPPAEKKKRGRKKKDADPETSATDPTAPVTPIDPKSPPRPQGTDWKNLPVDGNLAGVRPNDVMGLEDAGIKTLGQLASMIDSGLIHQSENLAKATIERAQTALTNWFIANS